MRRPASHAGAVGGATGDDDLVPGRAVPGTEPGPSEWTRTAQPTADAADRETVRRVYTVETLYAAVVDAYVDWQTAIVEAVLRACRCPATRPCTSSGTSGA